MMSDNTTAPTVDPSLDQVQRWMQAVIFDPDGVESGIASVEARARIPISPGQLEDIINRSQNLTSIERLQVYSNAYYARLLECLSEEFPSLVHALGDETFNAFAFGYLQQYPSRSYTLAELGAHFPQFLDETRPTKDGVARDTIDDPAAIESSWPDFLIDLATVERTYSEVFSGPGVEGQRTLQPEDVSAIPSERFADIRLIPVPCLRLLTLSYPVHDYISAVRHRNKTTLPDSAPTWLVITRREFVVRRCAVSLPEYQLLLAVQSGKTIGAAIEHVACQPDISLDTLASNMHDWFRHWAAAQFFRSVQFPASHSE